MTGPSDELESSLISGETVVYRTTKHWMAPIADSKWAIVLLLLFLVLAWLQPETSSGVAGAFADLIGFAKVALLVIALAWIAYNVVAWRTSRFAVTNRRVLGRDGLVRRRSTDTLLTSVSDVRSEVPLLGRSMGYGTIRILSASGDSGSDRFSTLRDVEGFRQAILEQKAGVPAPASPAPASTASPAAATTDVTATLASLAELRDSGAITAEEYEAKKTELLGRL
jgi:uncharacterized membrane protein YdbT with pleckstrin-like domain